MSYRNVLTSLDVKMLTSNIRTMLSDRNLYIRAITIAVVAPSAVALAAYNKYTCMILIWFFFFFGMLELSSLKRHIKMTLSMRLCSKDGDKLFHSSKEYTTPIPPKDKFTIFTAVISSFLPVAAYAGSEFFLVFLVLYFLVLSFFTLWCDGGEASIMYVFDKIVDRSEALGITFRGNLFAVDQTQYTTFQWFIDEERRLNAERKPMEVLLHLCLEYFGFVWVAGVTFPLLVYDCALVGRPWILASLIGNFTVDIVALVVGRALKGKTRSLCPSISPQKTMEGAVFGVLASAMVFATILHFLGGSSVGVFSFLPSYFVNFAFGLVLGVSGITGDLLQSLLKRAARVKDSGVLMPGHGGVLDRIDGLLLVFPTMYVCLLLISSSP